jgi:hypothetical protein
MTVTENSAPTWEALRTDESRFVEQHLLDAGFEVVDAYRYNPSSIRVRVIDPQFEGLSFNRRIDRIEAHLDRLPEAVQSEIIMLLAVAPSELTGNPRKSRLDSRNSEFEEPSL